MKRAAQIIVVAAVLLGQIGWATDAFAAAECHALSSHPAAQEAPASTHQGHAHAMHDRGSHDIPADTVAEDCRCVGGAHCGSFVMLTPSAAPVPHGTERPSFQPPVSLEDPSFAHRREPDRPPAGRA